jgi:type I restriction enzyme M protein
VVFTRTDSGGTDDVWFYDMQADGFSLDDKRNPLNGDHSSNNLPDLVARWGDREQEKARARTDQSFLVPKAEIAAKEYDLSLNRYKEVVYDEVAYAPPLVILAELERLEEEIRQGILELQQLLMR